MSDISIRYKCTLLLDKSRKKSKRVKGLWAIINTGIEASKGDFVVWLNDDCIVEQSWDKAAMDAVRPDVGLVVFRTRGIDGVNSFRTVDSLFGVPCANYAMLRKEIGIRFDEKFSWFHGDSDIPLQILSKTRFRVVIAQGNLVTHLHRQDGNRAENERDPRSLADRIYFEKKWRRSKFEEGWVFEESIFRHDILPLFLARRKRLLGLLKGKSERR